MLLGGGPIGGRAEEMVLQRLTGEAGAPMIIVLDGTVKVIHVRWDGLSVLANIAGPGDVLNADEFLTGTTTIARVAWVTTVILIAIPHRAFHEILASDTEIQRALTLTLARRIQALTNQHGHARRTVEQRLWAFLVDLARRHGTRTGDGSVTLQVGLTRTDLATAVNASDNSVETALHKLRKAGKLITGYRQVVLHELPTEEEFDRSFMNWNTPSTSAEQQ